jgi:hypothetical protein
MARQIILAFAAVLLTAAVGLSFVHPWGNVRSVPAGNELLGGSNLPPDVRHMLEEKCADCHSNRTHWPVYSRVMPAAWLVERDVSQGRAALNFSNWQSLRTEERIDALSRIAAEIRGAEMPPRQYTLMHPAGRVSDQEKQKIAAWARAERKRLRSAAQAEKEITGQ